MDLPAINNLLTGSAIIFTLAMLTARYEKADNAATTGFGVLACLASTFGIVISFIRSNYDTTWVFGFVVVLASAHIIWGLFRYKVIDQAD
jgi:hypothetical protein